MPSIGFIGLGIMGKPMSKNLLKAGYDLLVYDIVPACVKDVVAAGAKPAASIAEVAQKCQIICTMLPNGPQVKEVVLSPGGILDNAAKGSLLIDMSSIAPSVSIEVAAAIAKKGIRMIDAPVSGGEPKAMDGTLAFMVGGKQADFNEALPLLKKMGSSIVLVGEIGSGNTTKLVNQVIVAINIAAVSEGMLLARKCGVNLDKVFDAIKGGLAGSSVLNAKAPMMMDRNFKPGFKIDLHIKDLDNALNTAKEMGVPLLLTAEVMQMFNVAHLKGEGQSDHSALVKFYEGLAGDTVCHT
jgi:2-hydroxy-3-oxopropionate reductase